jgi:hypothetical protein
LKIKKENRSFGLLNYAILCKTDYLFIDSLFNEILIKLIIVFNVISINLLYDNDTHTEKEVAINTPPEIEKDGKRETH